MKRRNFLQFICLTPLLTQLPVTKCKTYNNIGKIKYLYVSNECLEDIKYWGVKQVDEKIRKEIYL